MRASEKERFYELIISMEKFNETWVNENNNRDSLISLKAKINDFWLPLVLLEILMHYMNRQLETSNSYLGLGADSDLGDTKRVFDTETGRNTLYFETN